MIAVHVKRMWVNRGEYKIDVKRSNTTCSSINCENLCTGILF